MNKKPSIKPLGDRVLVQLVEDAEQTVGGIIIPDSAKEKPQQARVVALGTGKLDEANKPLPFNVKEGDIVIISRYGGTPRSKSATKNIKSCARTTYWECSPNL
jgi:chaperonin GroES